MSMFLLMVQVPAVGPLEKSIKFLRNLLSLVAQAYVRPELGKEETELGAHSHPRLL